MAELYSLAWSGLKWSYTKYGIKGALGFALLGAVIYYVASERLEALFEQESAA